MRKVIKHFTELNTDELYKIIQLRIDVFILEQNCPYSDCDDKDRSAYHLMFFDQEELVAYCRILPEGISYSGYSSIGRVLTKASHRRMNLGRELMQEAIAETKHRFPYPIKISAQSYLEKFYSNLGFVVVTEEYLEDDIPHKGMVLK